MRPPGCDKTCAPRSEEGDAKMLGHVSKHEAGNWTSAPRKSGVRRCGKSCKLRWANHLRPDLKHESFTAQEEELIIKLHAAIGSRWSIIAQQLNGRTDNDVKNYWNTRLKKKLKEKGIDPITHRPFSHILRDYESIGGTSSHGIRIGSSINNRDLRSTFVPGFPSTHFPATEQPQLGLLAQLQSIKLVTETSIGGCSSFPSPPPSSSSSSVTSTESQSFGWKEFLLEDGELPSGDTNHEEEIEVKGVSSKTEAAVAEKMKGFESEMNVKGFQASTSSETPPECLFVDAMLKRDREMYFMEFPELWEEPHY